MAEQGGELSFVRCQSCQSLVPSISSRCKMCGAEMEGGAAAADNNRSRVRQRTSSESSDDLDKLLAALREEESQPKASPSAAENSAIASDKDEEDFLQKFLDGEKVEEKKMAPLKPFEVLPEEKPVTLTPDVVVESGLRARTKGGLSFGERKPTEPHQDIKEKRVDSKSLVQPVVKSEAKVDSVIVQPIVARESIPEKPVVVPPPIELSSAKVVQNEDKGGAKSDFKGSKVMSDSGKSSGKLVGWLIDYKDPQGKGIEIRDGKFFVTAKELKKGDMVLNSQTVSTPHAMMYASATSGMEVQDLMSDRGVFVRAAKEQVYKRIEDRQVLAHGDWLRFGDVEFLLALVPINATTK